MLVDPMHAIRLSIIVGWKRTHGGLAPSKQAVDAFVDIMPDFVSELRWIPSSEAKPSADEERVLLVTAAGAYWKEPSVQFGRYIPSLNEWRIGSSPSSWSDEEVIYWSPLPPIPRS